MENASERMKQAWKVRHQGRAARVVLVLKPVPVREKTGCIEIDAAPRFAVTAPKQLELLRPIADSTAFDLRIDAHYCSIAPLNPTLRSGKPGHIVPNDGMVRAACARPSQELDEVGFRELGHGDVGTAERELPCRELLFEDRR